MLNNALMHFHSLSCIWSENRLRDQKLAYDTEGLSKVRVQKTHFAVQTDENEN